MLYYHIFGAKETLDASKVSTQEQTSNGGRFSFTPLKPPKMRGAQTQSNCDPHTQCYSFWI